ncbi:MAG: right-handed parallel beta-helix repeat-containing protein, partial [bacterium]
TEERNIISGNTSAGIYFNGGSSNIIRGNYIGTTVSGEAALPNNYGILFYEGTDQNNTFEANVISGNSADGIIFYGANVKNNNIYNNKIGVSASGGVLPNNRYGIYLFSSSNNNVIGPNNVISNNGSAGVLMNGAATISNKITQCTFEANTGKGISLEAGANAGIPIPVITAMNINAGETIISGTANSGNTVEIFITEDDPGEDNQGEGKGYIGNATADAQGNWTFTTNEELGANVKLTATATDANKNTSEFAENYGGVVILGVPTGTVPLTIVRDGNNINITWDKALFPRIDLYALTGDGAGNYTNDATTWGAPVSAADADGAFTDVDQVGRGDGEKYYKGLVAGKVPTDAHPDGGTYISQARAVGKVNVSLYGGGRAFISTPFMTSSLNKAFGVDFANNDQLWYWDNSLGSFTKTFTFTGGSWPAEENANIAQGYWLDITSTNPGVLKTITIIGEVSSAPIRTNIYPGWDMVGNPFPKQTTNTGFNSGMSSNDQIWIWDNQNHLFTGTMSYTESGWNPAAQLLPGLGYRYNNLGVTGFQWETSN